MQRIVPAIVITLLGTPVVAQHAAHVHGTGTMNLAVEGELLSIDLIIPANDLVGFEHEPSDDADRAAVEKARDALMDGAALLGVPSAAGCTLDQVEVHSALLGDEDEHHHDDEKHDDHADKDHDDHAKDHDDEKHDDHADKDHDDEKHDDHADKNDDHDGEVHSEFRAEYRFTCAKPDALTMLEPTYFKTFPRAEVLKVQGITSSGQLSVELTPDESQLKLSD